MDKTECTSNCHTDLSFMGVAFPPKCDPDLCDYLYQSAEEDYCDVECCC